MRRVNRPRLIPSLTSPGSPGAFLFPSASPSPLTAQAEGGNLTPTLCGQPSAPCLPLPSPRGRQGDPLPFPPCPPLAPAGTVRTRPAGLPLPAVSPPLALPSASPRPAVGSPRPLPRPDRLPSLPSLPGRSARSGGRQPYLRKPPGMIDLRRRPASAGQGSPGASCPALKHRRPTLDCLILITLPKITGLKFQKTRGVEGSDSY